MIQELKEFVGELTHPFTFELDDFQKHSIQILQSNIPSNLLLAVPTGSGKSTPFEFAVLHGHSIGKKVIYLSPIKSLSNQKFHELSHKYPHISFGIITGDNKHNPMADVLIMTNEILLNMLLGNKVKVNDMDLNVNMEEVYCICIDEIHMINDQNRGHCLEKCLISIPKHITILMLSATIEKPLDFLTWVHSCNKNPSYLLTNQKRVVPLVFSYGIFCPKIVKEMLPQAKFLNRFNHLMDLSSKKIEDDKLNQMLRLSGYYSDNRNRVNLKWLIGECAKQLHEQDLCPAIFFVFSKKNCMNLANSIEMSFIDLSDSIVVERDIEYYLSKTTLKEQYKKTPQYTTLLRLARKGIAVHHSGLIPIFKEIIELLFAKKLIRVLFATETFSVGLNMPTKTVVFTDVYKYTDGGKRLLLSHEFIQMSGRAGRRGLDKVGHIILLPQIFSESIDKLELNSLLLGKSQTIESKFYIDEKLVLDFIKKNVPLDEFVKCSLLVTEMEKRKKFLIEELEKKQLIVQSTPIPDGFDEYNVQSKKLNSFIQPSPAQKKKILSLLKEFEKQSDFKKQYDVRNKVVTEYNSIQNELENIETYVSSSITEKISYLRSKGYFSENELTDKGKVSLLFNELDTIPGTELLFYDQLNFLSEEQWVVALTLLTDGRNSDEFSIPKDCLELYNFLNTLPCKKELNKQYVYPVLDWYCGKELHDICQDDDVFEGDFIKCIMKIINYIDEINEGLVLLNRLDLVQLLRKISETLKRDVISNESLYLKL